MTTYAATFFGTAILALLLTPVLIHLARAWGVVDGPGLRKIHADAIPHLGGIAIAVPTLLGVAAVLTLNNAIGEAFRAHFRETTGLLLAAVLIFALGLVDDLRGMRVRTKFAGQLAAAVLVCLAGIQIKGFGVTPDLFIGLGLLSVPVTVLWIVGVTNAVNLIDGMDGLAAGVAAIACGVLALFSIQSGDTLMAVLMLALLGSLCGFLFFNFNPAKIFMGDCGSLFLGFVLATAGVMCAQTKATAFALALPVLALGVPIFDTLFSMVRRALARRSMFAADNGHIHHKLLEMGLTQRQVVLSLYVLTLVATGIGGMTLVMHDVTRMVPLLIGLAVVVIAFRVVGVVRLRESFGRLQHNRTLMRQRQEDHRRFHDAQLCFQNIDDLDEWWASACMAADMLQFSGLKLRLGHRGAERVLSWHSDEDAPQSSGDRAELTVPLQTDGMPMALSAAIPIGGSLETAARRAALLGRILDENPPVDYVGGRERMAVGASRKVGSRRTGPKVMAWRPLRPRRGTVSLTD